jgi:hypothetical protein
MVMLKKKNRVKVACLSVNRIEGDFFYIQNHTFLMPLANDNILSKVWQYMNLAYHTFFRSIYKRHNVNRLKTYLVVNILIM